MRYLTAIEASRRIGVAEKTVRNWVASGKLTAHHPAKNRLAIPENEVEKLARERQLYQSAKAGPEAELSALKTKVTVLEERLKEIEARLDDQRAIAPSYTPMTDEYIAQPRRAYKRTTEATEGLPEGCILIRKFAELHGVAPATFRDQCVSGKVEAESRPKPGRPGETERYLTREQQSAAIDYWRRNGVRFSLPASE